MKKGKLISLMGINNIGKTTQQNMLVQALNESGYLVRSLKYPLYDLEPTGPRCNDYLRNGNPEQLTPREFQELCVQNRRDFQPKLEKLLTEYDFILAEMYTGSGICFGMADGIPKEDLIAMNEGLRVPDISILLDGERFLESREAGHNYEKDDGKMDIIRRNHLELARDFGWHIVNANQSVENVHQDILWIFLKSLQQENGNHVIVVDASDNFLRYEQRTDRSSDDIIRISGIWIENEKGEVLIAQRSFSKKNNPGKWGPAAAGTLEPGESYFSNALKETQEELGISLQEKDITFVGAFLGGDTHSYFAGTFFAQISSNTSFSLQQEEVENVCWISWEDLEKDIQENQDNYLLSLERGILKNIKDWKQKTAQL